MDRIKLAPVIRGSYMELVSAPIILLSEEQERMELPILSIGAELLPDTAAMSESEGEIARQVKEALGTFRGVDNAIPAAIRVPGFGSFYAGYSYNEAKEVRRNGGGFMRAAPKAGSGDVVRGKVALISGAAQGIGAEIARGLAKAGAYVIVADINTALAKTFVRELNNTDVRRASSLAVDVSDEDSVRMMADAVALELGGVDILISNAGILKAASVLEMALEDFELVTKVNYMAFFLVVKHIARLMIRQKAASPSLTSDIIQINSKSGLSGSNKNGAYAGGKFGGIGLVQSFAMELVEYGIKVNAICPGNFFDGPLWSDPEKGLFVQYLKTGKVPGAKSIAEVKKFYEEKVPMGRGCEGEDVLKAILYCIDQNYETGQAIPVTGGQIMLK